MKKLYFILILLFSILISCSKSSEPKRDENGNIVISVAARYSSNRPDDLFYKNKVEEFNNMNLGIKVVLDNIPTEATYLDKLRVSFANGDTPNIFLEHGGSRVKDYIDSDALVNLQEYFDEDPQWYNSFYSSLFKDLKYENIDGIWGVPYKSYVILIYYNKEIFKNNNIEVPETFDELLEVCKKLKQAGIKPFQVGEKDISRFGHFHNNIVIKSLGVNAAKDLADRTLSYDSPQMIESYRIIYDMIQNNYFGEDILSVDYNAEKANFESEQSAMIWDGSWYVSELYESSDIYDKVGVMSFPYINEEYKNEAQGGAADMFYISKLNKTPEEIEASVKFLKYITSVEYFEELNKVSVSIPPVKLENNNELNNPLMEEVLDIFAQYTNLSSDLQNIDPDSHMIDTVRNALQGLALGNTPEECARQIIERINTK